MYIVYQLIPERISEIQKFYKGILGSPAQHPDLLFPFFGINRLYDAEQAQLGNSLVTGKEFLSHMSFQVLFESEDMDVRPRPPRSELQLYNLLVVK